MPNGTGQTGVEVLFIRIMGRQNRRRKRHDNDQQQNRSPDQKACVALGLPIDHLHRCRKGDFFKRTCGFHNFFSFCLYEFSASTFRMTDLNYPFRFMGFEKKTGC
jgi:hypothetical protein